jgi:hypothetical protein
MWKSFLLNAALFVVATFGALELNKTKLLATPYVVVGGALLFAALHMVLGKWINSEHFNYMPDSRPIPPCPPGSERGGKNGMDCKSKGDRYGL